MGTPLYMSPEQLCGVRDIDGRSDVYALGVMLFEMLTGRPPFDGASLGEIVTKHLFVPPASLRTLAPAVPETVAAVVARALAKSPDARQQSAAELHAELAALRGGACSSAGARPLRWR